MTCRVCGSSLKNTKTHLPLKISDKNIVIFKELPVLQCESCVEYLIEDKVMARIDKILASMDHSVELEVIQYAA
jgi:YgiT-type zinc finger domain-containing protein